MAKEKPSSTDPASSEAPNPRKEKKDKKKRSETDGVHKSKSEKHKKKDKKLKDNDTTAVNGAAPAAPVDGDTAMTTQLLNALEAEKPGSVAVVKNGDGDGDGDVDMEVKVKVRGGTGGLVGALVPFANPLADEKVARKVFKGVRKCMFFFSFLLRMAMLP
ncbi:MAG: hypothetical protein L6R39_005002 [Caloplaca ligustica]|nr:MAG: hypothetical protein L6R39_005002 [Caloplaca ligustica]